MSHDPLEGLDGGAHPADDVQDPVPAADADTAASEKAEASDEAVRLPSTLTIAEVAELHAVFVERILAVAPFPIDGSEVESVDNAGLQLLAAVWQSAEAKGIDVELRSPSPALCTAARQIGLAERFGIQECTKAA